MVVETDKIRVNPSDGRDRGIRTLTPKHRYLKPACLPKLHHIPIWWTLRESNPSVFLFAKQVTTPCSPKAHLLSWELHKKNIASFYPVLIQRYALFSHSDDKSEPQSRRSETSYRKSEDSKHWEDFVSLQLSPTIQNLNYLNIFYSKNQIWALGYSHHHRVSSPFLERL